MILTLISDRYKRYPGNVRVLALPWIRKRGNSAAQLKVPHQGITLLVFIGFAWF